MMLTDSLPQILLSLMMSYLQTQNNKSYVTVFISHGRTNGLNGVRTTCHTDNRYGLVFYLLSVDGLWESRVHAKDGGWHFSSSL